MTVAYLLGSLNRGGTETLLLDVMKSAHVAPYQMLLVHRKGGAYMDDFRDTGVPMMQLAPRRFRLLRYLHALRRLFRSEHVTAVHAQQTIDALYAALATIGTGIPVVLTFHGFDFGASRLGRLLNRLAIRMADAVCFVSRTQRDYYIRRYGLQKLQNKLHVVYNGIDFRKLDSEYPVPDFLSVSDSATAGNSGHAAPGRIRLAMVGNFVSVRSQSVVCRSLQLLYEQGVSDFDFYFVGRRNEAEPWRYDDCVSFCREHGLDNVHFLGGRADVPAILQNIDAFVYSSDHDTFGIALVEAMAAGLPVLVNDWDAMREVVGNVPGAGLMWKSGNPESLAALLNDYISHPAAYNAQARQCKSSVRSCYSIQTHMDTLHRLYASL